MKNNIPTITVDPELRELILPSEKLVLGINGDVEVNTVQFQLPLAYRELELKRLTPRINYVNPNGDANYYESTMESDESNCYFLWPITPDITAYTGHVRFSLTLYQTEEGTILHKFNTRSATGRVYTGFEAEKQVTPEQQQTLLSKLETQIKADLNDHTEKLKSELTEKGKEILDGFGESGNVSEELKTIKRDLNTKLTAPPTPEVGKILKIKSVNEDGTFVCEWADGGSNLDVRINGESIVQDGVAEIPILNTDNGQFGVVKTRKLIYGIGANVNGELFVHEANNVNIDYRQQYRAITPYTMDYAVKAAMCDGKGAAWTADEQAAARERMGIDNYEDILDVTLEEDSALNFDLNGSFGHLYVYIDQSNVETPVMGTFYVYPICKKTKTVFNAYGPQTTANFKNIAGIWSFYNGVACRQMITTNAQKETTNYNSTLKVWDKTNCNNFPDSPFTGFASSTVFKARTKITIKGVRA